MPYIKKHDTIELKDLPFFFGDIKKALRASRSNIVRGIKKESLDRAHRLAVGRMPSRGGSYLAAMGWRQIRSDRRREVYEHFNDHPWAMTVENGTRPHTITSRHLMRANPVLPKGKTTKSGRVAFGTRYVTGHALGRSFKHPGSRKFRIFRDTYNYMKKKMPKIIEDGLAEAGFP